MARPDRSTFMNARGNVDNAATRQAAKDAMAAQVAETVRKNSEAIDTMKSGDRSSVAKLGFTGRDALNPNSRMSSQIEKQIGNAQARVSANPMHGLALTRIGDELSARIGHVAQRSNTDAESLQEAHGHIDNARAAVIGHQRAHGVGDSKSAMAYLASAGAHLATAINSLPPEHRGMLKDSWSIEDTDRTRKVVPWRTPKEEDPQAHSEFVSLQNAHTDINNVVKSYHEHVADVKKMPEGMEKITGKPFDETTRATLMRPTLTDLASRVGESKTRDQNIAEVSRRKAAEQEEPAPAKPKKPRDVTPRTLPGDHSNVIGTIRQPLLNPAAPKPETMGRSEYISLVSKVAAHHKAANPGKEFVGSDAWKRPIAYADVFGIKGDSINPPSEGRQRNAELATQSTDAGEDKGMTSNAVLNNNVTGRAVRDTSALGAATSTRGIRASEFSKGQAK